MDFERANTLFNIFTFSVSFSFRFSFGFFGNFWLFGNLFYSFGFRCNFLCTGFLSWYGFSNNSSSSSFGFSGFCRSNSFSFGRNNNFDFGRSCFSLCYFGFTSTLLSSWGGLNNRDSRSNGRSNGRCNSFGFGYFFGFGFSFGFNGVFLAIANVLRPLDGG